MKKIVYRDKLKRIVFYTVTIGKKTLVKNRQNKVVGFLRGGKSYDVKGRVILQIEAPGYVFEHSLVEKAKKENFIK